MIQPNLTILYVAQPQVSAEFYSELFAQQPVENSNTFVMYVFESGIQFGLWSNETVEPPVDENSNQGGEVALRLATTNQLEHYYQWALNRKLKIIQGMTDMSFGQTFTLKDPDGHRLRFYVQAPSNRG